MAKHVTLEERDRIAHLKSRGFTQAAIAKALGRGPSVIRVSCSGILLTMELNSRSATRLQNAIRQGYSLRVPVARSNGAQTRIGTA